MSASGGLEVWRGGVNTLECDAMGHMDVRFYVARAMEGLVGLASALGLNGAFRERANATLLVKDHHIRFLREARAGGHSDGNSSGSAGSDEVRVSGPAPAAWRADLLRSTDPCRIGIK